MLSEKQKKFIYESTAKINIAHGSVRSGKTHATAIRFAELVVDCPDNKIVIVGNSFDAVKTNVVKFFTDEIFVGHCASKAGGKSLIFGDKEIRVIGAHDEGSVRAIQGNTISLAYVDELTTIPTSFVDMLTTRLSHDWSKMIATCNPNSPVHHVKTNFIDCGDPTYCYSLKFDIDDNPILSEDKKNELKSKYTGLFYRRYILGEWVAAEGSIYSDFSRGTHVLPRSPHFADNYFCGVDYGVTNAFAAVLIGHSNSYSPHFWVEKELYWDSKKTFRQKLNSELADDLQRFVDGYNVRGIYLDPSAESFEVELKRRHMRVIQAKNDVFPGITFVADLISNHELKVVESCPNLIGEIEQYVWDSKKAERGLEEPVKRNDHACFGRRTPVAIDGMAGWPIYRVKVGDLVETTIGKKPVTHVHKRYAKCYQYQIADKWIECTSEHPFFTVNGGWKKADYLIQSDILVTRKLDWDSENLGHRSSSYFRGRNTDDILMLQMHLKEPILREEDGIYIEMCGNSIMGPFQKDFIYITSIKTPLIMIYPILNVFLQNDMQKNIQRIINEAFRSSAGEQLQSGINLLKESDGTLNMQEFSLLEEILRKKLNAVSVGRITERRNLLDRNFVRIVVNQSGEDVVELIMSLETAYYAADNFHVTRTQIPDTALTRVPKNLIGKRRVYNLSVENAEEYFADGILVHNCDALRYALYTAFGVKKNLKWGGDMGPNAGRSLGSSTQRTTDYGFR